MAAPDRSRSCPTDDSVRYAGSRATHRAAARDLGDLPDRRSDRATGSGDYDGLAGLWLADLQQSQIGCHAGQPQDVHMDGQGTSLGIHLAVDITAVGKRPSTPALAPGDQVANGIVGVAGGRHLAHGEARHDAAERHRVAVVRCVGDPAAHGRIDRQINDPYQHLPRARIGHRCLAQLEQIRGYRRRRPGNEADFAIHRKTFR